MFQVYEGPEEFVGCVLCHGIVALIAWTLTGTGAGYGLGFSIMKSWFFARLCDLEVANACELASVPGRCTVHSDRIRGEVAAMNGQW